MYIAEMYRRMYTILDRRTARGDYVRKLSILNIFSGPVNELSSENYLASILKFRRRSRGARSYRVTRRSAS